MKKTILIFVTAIGVFHAKAQNINAGGDRMVATGDEPMMQTITNPGEDLFTGWCIDVNATGGILTQNLTSNNPASNYQSPVNSNISNLKFNNGVTLGLDAEIAYFFGKKKHFGIGTGLLYLYQQGNVTMDNFHIEYQAIDNFGNTFRQVIAADQPIKESLTISNFNIPVLFKYKTKLSRRLGFALDAGAVINLQERNNYNTNASFDYEAIYKYVANENGGTTAVYDNSTIPAASDVLITKDQYLNTHTTAELQNYFSTLKSEGYNVGLGIKPNSNTGNVSYKIGSVGLLVRPAISFYLSDYVALNLGVFYLYQGFNNNATPNYEVTNKAGTYSSVLNSVTTAANNSYGISFGVRYLFHKRRPAEIEVIPVTDDSDVAPAPVEPPPPPAPAPPPPPAKAEDEEKVFPPILFDLDKVRIKPSSYPTLEDAVHKIEKNKDAYLEINGYTDGTGTASYNSGLSKRRAAVVKNYLRHKGVNPKLMKTIGHGERSPVASNKTKAGRAKNRRVVVKLKKDGK
jgi:outer membrane protein OmpA-like peptidoglycan-associated protein